MRVRGKSNGRIKGRGHLCGNVKKIDTLIRSGRAVSDDVVEKVFADMVDVVREPFWNPRATVHCVTIVTGLLFGRRDYENALDAWRKVPPVLAKSAQKAFRAIAERDDLHEILTSKAAQSDAMCCALAYALRRPDSRASGTLENQ